MQSLIEQLYHACFNTDAELELGATRMSIPGKCSSRTGSVQHKGVMLCRGGSIKLKALAFSQ